MKKWLGRLVNAYTGAAVGLWCGGSLCVNVVATALEGDPASPETAWAKMLTHNLLGMMFCIGGSTISGAIGFHFLGVFLRNSSKPKSRLHEPPPIAHS